MKCRNFCPNSTLTLITNPFQISWMWRLIGQRNAVPSSLYTNTTNTTKRTSIRKALKPGAASISMDLCGKSAWSAHTPRTLEWSTKWRYAAATIIHQNLISVCPEQWGTSEINRFSLLRSLKFYDELIRIALHTIPLWNTLINPLRILQASAVPMWLVATGYHMPNYTSSSLSSGVRDLIV